MPLWSVRIQAVFFKHFVAEDTYYGSTYEGIPSVNKVVKVEHASTCTSAGSSAKKKTRMLHIEKGRKEGSSWTKVPRAYTTDIMRGSCTT
eukprot:scaffold270603_cov19-Tisochrysis_lutea.AAC.1